jgi:TIR domain
MSKIFLSYVHADSEADAGRLADTLASEFPDANLFIDARDIELGTNWKRVIERAIEDSVILLCAMGPDWKLSPAVELELAQAFRSNVPVVPILFREAQIVALTDALPPHIAELKDRNAISIEHGSWHRDVARLIDLIRKVLSEPSRARVIIDPPDSKRLLEIEPSPFDSVELLNYAQDLAECLEDPEVFAEAKDAVVHFETELEQKREYDSEMMNLWGAYRNIRGPEPRLIQIVQAAKKRLQIEQDVRDLLGFDFALYRNSYELADQYRKVALYLNDDKLLAELAELHQEFLAAVDDFKNGGMSQPSVPKQEFEEILSAAKKRLRAELPGITKRYPDRKWA